MTTAKRIRIIGREAADIASHVSAYVKPGNNWAEVQVLRECNHGCKLYVRRRGCVDQYQLWHSTAYGCRLGASDATRAVPVSIAPKGQPTVESSDQLLDRLGSAAPDIGPIDTLAAELLAGRMEIEADPLPEFIDGICAAVSGESQLQFAG